MIAQDLIVLEAMAREIQRDNESLARRILEMIDLADKVADRLKRELPNEAEKVAPMIAGLKAMAAQIRGGKV